MWASHPWSARAWSLLSANFHVDTWSDLSLWKEKSEALVFNSVNNIPARWNYQCHPLYSQAKAMVLSKKVENEFVVGQNTSTSTPAQRYVHMSNLCERLKALSQTSLPIWNQINTRLESLEKKVISLTTGAEVVEEDKEKAKTSARAISRKRTSGDTINRSKYSKR